MLNDIESKRNNGDQRNFWEISRKILPKTKRERVVPTLNSYYDYVKGLSVSFRPLDVPDES